MKKILLIILTISFCGLTACKTGTKKGGDMDKETLVKIETTLGDIEVKLYNETCLLYTSDAADEKERKN